MTNDIIVDEATSDVQPVALATVDSQLSATSQDQLSASSSSLSVATAMASVAMTIGFIYRSADVASTQRRPQKRCSVAPDGTATARVYNQV